MEPTNSEEMEVAPEQVISSSEKDERLSEDGEEIK
jgi:hypothetical protein